MSHYDEQYRRSLEIGEYDPVPFDKTKFDPVNYPKHYNSYPGIEVIQLTEHMNFCKGNVVKYVARAEHKGNELEDLRKAQWYLNREIQRLEDKEIEEAFARNNELTEKVYNNWMYSGE